MKRKHSSTATDAGAAPPPSAPSTSPSTVTSTPPPTTTPTTTTTTTATTTPAAAAADAAPTSFASFDLDPRLLQGIAKAAFAAPTLVQAKAIPLALAGKDILARARTGSGKTAAYLIPLLQGILKAKSSDDATAAIRALVLVPTKELAEQVLRMAETLAAACGKAVRVVNIATSAGDAVQRALLAERPDVVVATPARALAQVAALGTEVATLVLDEADLLCSYGYEEDLQGIRKALPRGVQTFVMSATLSKEVEMLKTLFCRSPAILRLEEGEAEEAGEGVKQFTVQCAEDEKFLLLYVIFKLKLIKGKVIVFVVDIDRCYRIKLFLEQFGIRSCVLNSELPLNSRLHIVDEFNKGVYDIIIATDENEVLGDDDDEPAPAKSTPKSTTDAATDAAAASDDEAAQPKKKKRRKPRLDKEYGVSRGLDFQHVACVLNFDLPRTSKSYTHRIGRTARAGRSGMAMSFIVPAHLHGKHKPTSIASTARDPAVLAKITKSQSRLGRTLQPYVFDMTQVASFRYRMDDALRAVTRTAVREARTRELRAELLASEKLKRHFEENPEDLKHLRHDGELRAARIQPHLKHVPEYLLPKGGAGGLVQGEQQMGVALRKVGGGNRIRKARVRNRAKAAKRARDPLKVFAKK
ncbi:ATP-dependent RNA helicase dbp9 [Geopyxis carbonaria]|nr:ATP-dependent RNA helicase dbp9 [Geopyxis carbonaria]